MQIKDFVQKYDSQNQFKVLKETYKQIEFAWNNKIELSNLKRKKFSSVVFCGLGGSAISGDLLRDYLGDEIEIPFEVIRGYNIPSYVNEKTLIIISSYSGNTEETISCFNQALKKKSSIVIISSGGILTETAKKKKFPFIKIVEGFQPRFALGLSFFSLLKVFQELGYISENRNVKEISELWKRKGEEYSTENNFAIKIAEQLIGLIPVIYSSEFLSSTGYRFKCQLNENSKVHSFHNNIPEMNHNEIIGWELFKEKQFQVKVINLIDVDYHHQNKKRFQILNELIKSRKVDSLSINSSEKSKKVRIMDLIFLCDWITFYMAVLRGFDPSEIDFIYQMKKSLV
jgi:glucose/mannose-6-phosphate isomerase